MPQPPFNTSPPRPIELPKIYIAGKMGHPNFRQSLGLGARDMAVFNKPIHFHGWDYRYVGPIVPSCDHGCWHRICDGRPFYESGFVGVGKKSIQIESDGLGKIVQANLSQLKHADLLFVWLDGFDAYGTLAEIGYASALGIPIYIGLREDVFPEDYGHFEDHSWDDIKNLLPGKELWYIVEMAKCAFIACTPQEAFIRAMRNYNLDCQPKWPNLLETSKVYLPGKI